MAPLTTGTIEHRGAIRQLQQFDQACDFRAIDRLLEQRFELEEIALVEVGGPPGAFDAAQKNTGSRYAPNTSSSAARISYSVA